MPGWNILWDSFRKHEKMFHRLRRLYCWVILFRKVRLEKIVEVKICYPNRSLKINEKWCTYLREKWNALNIFHSFLCKVLRVGKNSYFIGQKYSKYSESNTTDKVHNTKNLISTISWFIARKYSSKSNLCIPKENDKSFLEQATQL